jgi:hypothetical protein
MFRKQITSKAIVDAANALNAVWEGSNALVEDDVRVDFALMHYGMKEKNPLDSVRFYSKREPNSKPLFPVFGIPVHTCFFPCF